MATIENVTPEELERLKAQAVAQVNPKQPEIVTNSPDKVKAHEEIMAKILNKETTQPKKQNIDYGKMFKIDDLPSSYLFYPEGTEFYGRALELPELKKLAQMTPLNVNSVINDVLRCAIKGLDWEDVLLGDKLFIIMWLRAYTYPDSSYTISFDCPNCGSKDAAFSFTIENISIKHIDRDFDVNEPLELPNGDFLVLKYMTIGDETKVEKFKNSVKKSSMKFDEDNIFLAAAISTINGEQKTLMEKYEYIDKKIKPQDMSHIEGRIDRMGFGIDEDLNVVCSNCGGSATTALQFRKAFWIPAVKPRKPA